MRLRDRVAIITGATSGIGRATAERFVGEGARVTINGRSEEDGRAVERELRERARRQGAGDALYARADVSLAGEARRAVEATVRRWGGVDVLVNNAATMTFELVAELEEADWDRVLAVNLKGAYLFSRYCLPHMGPGSAIVNVSSVHARATGAGVVPYAASKAGLEAFTRGLAVECDERKIRVNAVRPGAVDTPMLWSNPKVRSGEEQVVALELGQPEEIAAAILFLVSSEASFINGAVLDVDGGRLAHLGGHEAEREAPGAAEAQAPTEKAAESDPTGRRGGEGSAAAPLGTCRPSTTGRTAR